jgi:hypothetical protein
MRCSAPVSTPIGYQAHPVEIPRRERMLLGMTLQIDIWHPDRSQRIMQVILHLSAAQV